MNKKELVLMCGAPGSGKSTYIASHAGPNDIVISRDAIRFSHLHEGEYYFSHEDEVFKEFIEQIQTALNTSGIEKVYCDATHISQASRDKVCDKLNMENVKNILCIVILPSLEEVIKRNGNRRGHSRAYVPVSVVRRMYYQFERPEYDTNYPKDTKYVEVPESWEKFG